MLILRGFNIAMIFYNISLDEIKKYEYNKVLTADDAVGTLLYFIFQIKSYAFLMVRFIISPMTAKHSSMIKVEL